MPTPKKGARLGGSAQHQKSILSNLAAQLFEHGAIKTTHAKAKVLRPYAEKLITRAKAGTIHDRREVLKHVPQKDVVAYLFDELAPKFANRDGGYTRIIKLENRRGDNAQVSQISLVLEETVTTEATRATRAAASRKAEEAEETAAEVEVEAEETETAEEQDAPEVETDEATDAEVEAEAEEAEVDASDAEEADAEADADAEEKEEK